MITMLAVKFDSTNDHKKFTPFDIEIAKYRALKLSIEYEYFACAAEVNFMLLPDEEPAAVYHSPRRGRLGPSTTLLHGFPQDEGSLG